MPETSAGGSDGAMPTLIRWLARSRGLSRYQKVRAGGAPDASAGHQFESRLVRDTHAG